MNNLDKYKVIYGPTKIADFIVRVNDIEDHSRMVNLAYKTFGRDGLVILKAVLESYESVA